MRELLDRLQEKTRVFMAGRCGADRLCVATAVLALLLTLLGRALDSVLPAALAAAVMAVTLWRALSRNTESRRRENDTYLRLTSKPRAWITGWWRRRLQSGEYRFFVCPGCKCRLRVPRGKGSVQITCPRCGRSFSGRA